MPACRSNCPMPACRRRWAQYSVPPSSTESAALLLGALALMLQLPAARSATAQVAAPVAATATAPVLHLQDDDQQALDLARPAQRIVSLAPGATAMLFAAGAGERVVGTSQYSTEPAAANAIPRIGDAQSFDLERILALH